MYPVPLIAFAAPIFFIWEIVQLVMAEKILGIKQIKNGTDPRKEGPREPVAAGWTLMLIASWLWIGMMLVHDFGRAYVVVMIVVTLVAYGLRKSTELKWTLVILTFEGAIRIGMLLAIMGRIYRSQYM